ncbi:hypothetical protein PanWU01x14_270200 [Parasponia andersonii]|uniref:Uncharacterized protein n=1 Tax=Parasponia andersonii TaxID=3476 RepID=A0A2P5B5A9_PARAD|nr:hypothetical protein PanWU01x14_270200 [Parasponia andersonii]
MNVLKHQYKLIAYCRNYSLNVYQEKRGTTTVEELDLWKNVNDKDNIGAPKKEKKNKRYKCNLESVVLS